MTNAIIPDLSTPKPPRMKYGLGSSGMYFWFVSSQYPIIRRNLDDVFLLLRTVMDAQKYGVFLFPRLISELDVPFSHGFHNYRTKISFCGSLLLIVQSKSCWYFLYFLLSTRESTRNSLKMRLDTSRMGTICALPSGSKGILAEKFIGSYQYSRGAGIYLMLSMGAHGNGACVTRCQKTSSRSCHCTQGDPSFVSSCTWDARPLM